MPAGDRRRHRRQPARPPAADTLAVAMAPPNTSLLAPNPSRPAPAATVRVRRHVVGLDAGASWPAERGPAAFSGAAGPPPALGLRVPPTARRISRASRKPSTPPRTKYGTSPFIAPPRPAIPRWAPNI